MLTDCVSLSSAAGVHPVLLWSSSLWSSLLLAHCRNVDCITAHGVMHVLESAAHAPICSSAVVQEGSLEDYCYLFILISDIVNLYFRVNMVKDYFRVKMFNE